MHFVASSSSAPIEPASRGQLSVLNSQLGALGAYLQWWRQKLGTVILDGYVMLNASFSFCFAKPSAQHPVSPKSVCCAGTGVCLASLPFCAGLPTTTLECVLVGGQGREMT